MSRSIYSRLRALAGEPPAVTRRDFLVSSLAATAGLLSARSLWAGQDPKPSGKRVVVVGGGFAGLACAFELKQGGYDVTVIEARDQVGGRVRSSDKFVAGRNVEFGGELIGTNHPTWQRYHQALNLELLEMSEDETLEQPIVLDGKRIDREEAKKLLEEMDEVFKKIDAEAEPVVVDEPWKTPNAKALDQRNTRTWLDQLKDASERCRKLLAVEFYANNGQKLEQQSFLGNLCQVKGGGGATAYRDESETHRCKGGNQRLANVLAAKIGETRVVLGLPVTRIDYGGKNVVVHCKDGRTLECDDVVLAVPPSIWHKIEFNPGLPRTLTPQMGKNVKYFVPLKSRFWKDGGREQYSIADGKVTMTWEATDGQAGDDKIVMVAFSGAQAAEACIALAADQRDQAYADEIELLYPGFKAAVDGKPTFMDWTNEPWTKASYSFPAPGQITTVGPVLYEGLGKLHFAGEHTCYKFVGYMEGALNSGASLAQRLALRDAVIRK